MERLDVVIGSGHCCFQRGFAAGLVGWPCLYLRRIGRLSLKWTLSAFEGCTLVSSDSDSESIIGVFTILNRGLMLLSI